MEIAEILDQLEIHTGRFPRAAVEMAVAQREQITPELIRILEDTVIHAERNEVRSDYMAHMYAMFLLAQFRETRAYPLIVRLASLPSDDVDELFGDFITEDLGRVLASVCGGDLSGIQSLIENEAAYEFVRAAAVSSLVSLVAFGQTSRDTVVEYFGQLYRNKLERKWSHVWDTLVLYSCDLYPEELLHEIGRAMDDGLIDPGFIELKHVRRDLATGKELVLAKLGNDPHRHLVKDTVDEMQGWACFNESNTKRKAQPPLKPATTLPAWRSSPKTGRNEMCPCGSGKKYKKCCGAG